MYSFLCDLTFLIENIISEDIFLREDLSVAKILHSRIDDERKRMLKCQFLYGKHLRRNLQRYLICGLVAFLVLALMIYGRFDLFAIANGTVALISSGLFVYWRFSTDILKKYHAFRLSFEVHDLIRSVREHNTLSRSVLKFNQNYESILHRNGLVYSERSPYRFLWTSWQQLVDSIRSEQVSVNKELLRNIQYLVKYAEVVEEFELCFLNHMQTIIIDNLRINELCDLFLLLQSNFFLVLVLSLCNRVNLQSDSTLKQLVVNLNCLIRDSNRKLHSDYENMKLLSEPESMSPPQPSLETNKCRSTLFKNMIEWITKLGARIGKALAIDSRSNKSDAINFEEIKLRKLIFDLTVKFKITHSIILNIEEISKQTVNENDVESSDSKHTKIEKNLTLLNNLFAECKNLITLLNTNCLKSSKRNESVRETNDNESQQCDINDIPEAPVHYEPLEDQVFQLTPQRPIGTRIPPKRSPIESSPARPKENVDFLNELKQVLKSRESEWQQRERVALDRSTATGPDPLTDTDVASETLPYELDDCIEEECENQTEDDLQKEISEMIAVNEAWSQLLLTNKSLPTSDQEVFTSNYNDDDDYDDDDNADS